MSAGATARSPFIAPGPLRFRWDQYQRMVDSGALDGVRVMFIDGELVPMAAMLEPHSCGVSLTLHELQRIFGVGFYVRPQLPLRQGNHDPEPDLAVVPGGPRDYKRMPTTAILVVEVADSSFSYDTGKKAEIYSSAGLADYWVLDIDDRQLIVFRDPSPAGYQSKLTFAETESIAPLAAPTSPVRVADLLP